MATAQWNELLDCLPDAAAVTDAAGHILSLNEAFRRATGAPAAQLYGRSIAAFLHLPARDEAVASALHHFEHAAAEPLVGSAVLGSRGRRGRRCEVRIGRIDREAQGLFLFVLRELAPAQRALRRLRQAARTDALTGLLNRAALSLDMELAVLDAQREGRRLALLFIDLDGFKQVNDTHGHDVGDRTLAEIARRFARTVRREDRLARWGGDEFACLVELPEGNKAVLEIADRLLVEASRPLPPPLDSGLGASIGIAILPDDATSTCDLLSCADRALYEAKARSGRTWCAFAPEFATRSQARERLRHEITRAMRGDELQLYYQPIVDARTLEPTCAEALIRWLHPERGVLAPGAFLSLLTSSGDKTLRLLEVQIERAMRDAPDLLTAVSQIALNVDARLIGRAAAFELLDPLHARLGDAGGVLCVELTEMAFDEQPQKLQTFIHDVRRRGMRLAIDDFGKGQASLLRLRDIRFDILKVDRAFIRSIAVNARDRTISALAAKVADELSGTSVAEGVETADQVAWARRLGYHALQGYRIGRPMPVGAFTEWRRRWDAVGRQRLLAEIGEEAMDVRPSHRSDLSDN